MKAVKKNFANSLNIRKRINDNEDWYMMHDFPKSFGIDTELIHNFPELKETQASWMYTENEGKFSCCIDLVDGYILPSSYTEYKKEYKIPELNERFYGSENDRKASRVETFLGERYPKF